MSSGLVVSSLSQSLSIRNVVPKGALPSNELATLQLGGSYPTGWSPEPTAPPELTAEPFSLLFTSTPNEAFSSTPWAAGAKSRTVAPAAVAMVILLDLGHQQAKGEGMLLCG